jgi:hypothetical protein
LVVIIGLGAIAGISALVDGDRTVLGTAFAKGDLAEGKFVESDTHLYLKDAIEINNLKIERDFDAGVSYRIVFYNKNMEYVGETEALMGNWDIADHEAEFATEGDLKGAEFARIVVSMPEADENGKISSTEVLKYAGELKITYTK